MECPKCGSHTKTDYIKAIHHCTNYRIRKCPKCEISFKTTEKPIFGTLPHEIQKKFMENGDRQAWWKDRK